MSFFVCSIKGRRKYKDSSTQACVVADLHDNERCYLDDDELSQESIVDVDLSALVLRPVGVEYNEWLATHSELEFKLNNIKYNSWRRSPSTTFTY